ncbi:hypothetical protein C8J56DRAFT_886722 [Mycena floridula]|nr:hypothetical protein C8J56DRAFT_886722 [Mycena floridula]
MTLARKIGERGVGRLSASQNLFSGRWRDDVPQSVPSGTMVEYSALRRDEGNDTRLEGAKPVLSSGPHRPKRADIVQRIWRKRLFSQSVIQRSYHAAPAKGPDFSFVEEARVSSEARKMFDDPFTQPSANLGMAGREVEIQNVKSPYASQTDILKIEALEQEMALKEEEDEPLQEDELMLDPSNHEVAEVSDCVPWIILKRTGPDLDPRKSAAVAYHPLTLLRQVEYEYDENSAGPSPATSVLVTNIFPGTSISAIEEYFRSKDLVSLAAPLHKGKTLGIVWLTFASHAEAKRCVELQTGKEGRSYITMWEKVPSDGLSVVFDHDDVLRGAVSKVLQGRRDCVWYNLSGPEPEQRPSVYTASPSITLTVAEDPRVPRGLDVTTVRISPRPSFRLPPAGPKRQRRSGVPPTGPRSLMAISGPSNPPLLSLSSSLLYIANPSLEPTESSRPAHVESSAIPSSQKLPETGLPPRPFDSIPLDSPLRKPSRDLYASRMSSDTGAHRTRRGRKGKKSRESSDSSNEDKESSSSQLSQKTRPAVASSARQHLRDIVEHAMRPTATTKEIANSEGVSMEDVKDYRSRNLKRIMFGGDDGHSKRHRVQFE